ncbi:MAG: MBL fold metallo-hydrolase [Clostridiaceae bacterium]|nr:MBL fold metallo-hydrolase [Clostridiaceae bacterium]
MRTKYLSTAIILILALFLVSCTIQYTAPDSLETEEVQGELLVHFLDVGQADCILIQEPGGKAMLIDAGNNADSKFIIDYLEEKKIERLEYVIGTHPHEDHIGSLDSVIYAFDIGQVFMPKRANTTKTFEDVLQAISDKGLKVTTPKVGDTYTLGEARWTILAPNREDYKEINDSSIVIRLVYGDTSFMFTGDAEEESEADILKNSGQITNSLKSDVLKVGHHGSSTSTSDSFLEAVSPQYAVICVGKDNSYGHPHRETMKKLSEKGIEIFRTDESGTIIASSDGKTVEVKKE